MKMWYNMFINKLNMIHHIVYRTTDVTTGEYYIGFHSYDDQDPPVYWGSFNRREWNPNEENLIRETLMEFATRDAAREAEPGFIRPHLDDPLCWNGHANMMPESFDLWGKPMLDETKLKQSLAKKDKKFTSEHRENISKNHVGMKDKSQSFETREKIRLSLKGKTLTPSQIVECPYCNESFIGRGIGIHKQYCKKKPK